MRVASIAGLLLGATGAASAAPRWERAAAPWPGDVVGALALDPASGRLALGGTRGVRVIGGEREIELVRSGVRDLVFLPDGALLAATEDGVWRVDPDGRHVRETLGPGEARNVVRIAAAAGFAAAATEAGVVLRDRAGRWSRRAELPRAGATLVALRARGRDVELWAVVAGGLWLGAFPADAPELSLFAERVVLPESGSGALPVDVAFELPEADVALVTPNGFAVRDAGGAWRMLRPSWPPGATPIRFGLAADLRALATSVGLLLAPALAGPWERAAAPAGSDPSLALAARGGELVVATHREVLRAEGVGAARAAAAGPAPAQVALPPTAADAPLPPVGPDILAVQRAALAYVALEPEIANSLRARAGRSRWLPVLSFRVGAERERFDGRGWDQSFVSGGLRDLYDEGHDRSDDVSLDLTLAWDLGDGVFNPEEIDVSRELRPVIALRDDVLDEVTQLFFERRRALAALAQPPETEAEAASLRLRSAELAAGIDAWTGGWFTRALQGPDTPRNGGLR